MTTVAITPSGSSDDYNKIQSKINNISSGDILQMNGNFLLKRVIQPKNNTTIVINGSVKMNGSYNVDLFNINNQHDITITGPENGYGELIGDPSKPVQNTNRICGTSTLESSGWGIRTCGSNKQSYNITFKNLKCHDFRQSGIALNQLKYGGLVENCICNNNGQNGIGFGDVIGVVARNNYCEGNRDGGVNFEDAWDFQSIDNICRANGRHNSQIEHGVNGKIVGGSYINGIGDGIQIRARAKSPYEKSENIQVTGACIKNNATNGVTLIDSDKITVINNTIYKNTRKPISITGGTKIITSPNNTTSDCNVTPPPVEIWQCETPLNGYEKSNLGNRRLNSNCNPIIPPECKNITCTFTIEQ